METEYLEDESYEDSEYDDDPEMTWEEKVQDYIEELKDMGIDLYSFDTWK
jgi:hypothetical protein